MTQTRPSLPCQIEDRPLASGFFFNHYEEQRTFILFFKKWPFRFSNSMFCSSGHKGRSRQATAGLHGAANYEIGSTRPRHRECSQHYVFPIQHPDKPAPACPCEPLPPSRIVSLCVCFAICY